MQIWFVLAFAVIGALVSTTCGFLVGNRFTYILFVSLLSTISFAAFGFGVYTVLEKKVPEFLEFLNGISLGGFGGNSGHSEDELGSSEGFGSSSEALGSDDFGVQATSDPTMDAKLAMAKSGKFGDHIIVDKIAIKNEPKLMAEAIRTMMAKDDTQEG
ncbi:hypothetical protein P3G55_05185 [Leptospira sp. 96542]|nr:hypothetical protein [Leptospira sp. 96542]